MKRIKWIIAINCLLVSLLSRAQDSLSLQVKLSGQASIAEDNDFIPTKRYIILYAEPIAMLDWVNGASYRFGAQYAFAPNWAVYGTYGGYMEEGYVLRTGIKRYFKEANSARHALGIEYINNWHIFTTHDWYRKYNSAGIPYPDGDPVSITAEKYINAISAMYSREEFWRHHWVFEFYGGAGVKFRHALVSLPQSTLDKLYHYNESMMEASAFTPGEGLTLDLRLGIKIGRVL